MRCCLSVANQLLELPGTYNLRHVGGYTTADGYQTRSFALFRSDSLHLLTAEGQAALLDYGLCTIIDLRREAELEIEPNVLAAHSGIRYLHLPLYNSWRDIMPEGGPPRSLLHLYQLIVDGCHETMGRVLCAAASPHSLPLLVHCKVGKDRTGLVIALLLAAAGVPREIIAEDYAHSGHNLQPLMPELMAAAQRDGLNLERYALLLQSPAQTMLDLLAYLDETYGSVETYLDTIGFEADCRATLREQLLRK